MGPANSKKAGTDELEAVAYAQLRSLAQRFMGGERSTHTLQPTELVHEAWMRIARAQGLDQTDRARFLGMAATAMRRILVDHARARLADRRDAGRVEPLLEEPAMLEDAERIDAIDNALVGLAQRDPDLRRLVELRFFAGLTVEESAHALGVSPRTVKREWRLARAWLHSRLEEDGHGS